jgi:lysozyme
MPDPMNARAGVTNESANKAKIAIGSAIGGAIVLAVATIAPWEGKRNDPYLDIVKVRTVCYGETRVPMRRYSDQECLAMLQKAVEQDYAPAVFKCVPSLKDPARANQAAASISLAYNIGTSGFCKSTAARLMNAGDWKGGCLAIARFNKAGGRVIQGLVNRRADEVRLCLKGAV